MWPRGLSISTSAIENELLEQTANEVFDELLARLTAEFLRVYLALRHGGDVAASRRRRRQSPQYARRDP